MSIAVKTGLQGRGLGSVLVDQFLDRMRRRNVPAVSLSTDRDENERVNVFYRRKGFRIAREYATSEGRWMNEYVIDLKLGGRYSTEGPDDRAAAA
jgi:ribosomal protein S18 acetylase RimI-like enzyme